MILGITGTRSGMTLPQLRTLFDLLSKLDAVPAAAEFHHGSCQGADVQAARCVSLIRESYVGSGVGCVIVSHPGPDGDTCRRDSGVDDAVLPGKNHFARNRDIVNVCDLLIVCPGQMSHQPKGGTWMTFDYARKQGKPVRVVWPDGTATLYPEEKNHGEESKAGAPQRHGA
jgi:hypothetical protein